MQKQKDSAETRNKHTYNRYVVICIAAFVIICFGLLEISPLGGSVRFYTKWLECGQKPVATRVQLSFSAVPPSYTDTPVFNLYRGQPDYFYTPLEAEQAGYSASSTSYEFPHLDQNKR